ncbi:MAG: lysylphosphatidylglycerol synthetase family protein, partial [Desulfovibrio sp.]|nr:lysylphosphatidylglycerol synthetase family protein [Desulfovibrio sp.]
QEPIPLFWLCCAFAVLVLAGGLVWTLYHTAWSHSADWWANAAPNTARNTYAFVGIVVGLVLSWMWRVALRTRARLNEKK